MQICFDLQKSEASLEPKKNYTETWSNFPMECPHRIPKKEFPHRVPTHNSHTGAIKWFDNGKHLQKLVNQLWIHERIEFTKISKSLWNLLNFVKNILEFTKL